MFDPLICAYYRQVAAIHSFRNFYPVWNKKNNYRPKDNHVGRLTKPKNNYKDKYEDYNDKHVLRLKRDPRKCALERESQAISDALIAIISLYVISLLL